MKRNIPHPSGTAARLGFTLVEMLVAVALVLTIMVLMAQVFDVAASTARKERGTAENDQQARTFTVLLKQDLANRSMVRVLPFYPRTTGIVPPDQDRLGYFYYAENDPGNQTDDVLAFTVTTRNFITNTDNGQQPYQGKATVLVDPNVGSDGVDDDLDGTIDDADESVPENYLRFHPNQPEGDDAVLNTSPTTSYTPATSSAGMLNNIGMSRTAEVVYFLRGSNLYRRVILIRDPYDVSGSLPESYMLGDYPGSPTYAPLGSGEFWRDFDYSAYNHYSDDGTVQNSYGPRFNTIDSLNNDSTSNPNEALNIYQVTTALGAPHRRFGHNPFDLLGRPREFVQAPGGGVEDVNLNGWLDPGEDTVIANGKLDDEFMGRFVSQETAHQDFNYPGQATIGGGNPNPYTRSLALHPTTRLVTAFGNQYYNRGEDLLMTNVIEFDVKLMDDGLPTPSFVDLGHSLRESDYGGDLNYNSNDDPVGFYNITSNRSYNGTTGQTIRQALLENTDYHYDSTSKRYVMDTVVLRYGNRFDTWYAEKITSNTAAGDPAVEPPPYRPYSPGPDGAPGVATIDDDSNLTADDASELGYPGSDENPLPNDYTYKYPLRGIQITVRFTDPSTDLIRQVTIIQSFVAPVDF